MRPIFTAAPRANGLPPNSLKGFSGIVADSGEGRWVIEATIEEAVPADVLATALFARLRSRKDHTFGGRPISAMRFAFAGHVEAASKG